jgi:hypothetical protein
MVGRYAGLTPKLQLPRNCSRNYAPDTSRLLDIEAEIFEVMRVKAV